MSENTPPFRRELSRVDRVLLLAMEVVAGLVAALGATGIVIDGIRRLSGASVAVAGMLIGNARTPKFTQSLPAVTDAHYETVTITVTNPPTSARWLLWGEQAVSILAVIGVCVAVIWLCERIWRRRPFGRSITGALVATAARVMAGGLASQFLAAAGRSQIVAFLGVEESTAGASLDIPQGYEGFASYALSLSLAPVGIAGALLVVALAFRIGARLQLDVEGLV